jgi:multidrug efflux pump subunit AcrA (membrane-fusion protein)
MISGLMLVGFGAIVAASQVARTDAGPQRGAVIAESSDVRSALEIPATIDLDPRLVFPVHGPSEFRVDRVLVDVGQRVKKGDPLLELSRVLPVEGQSGEATAEKPMILRSPSDGVVIRRMVVNGSYYTAVDILLTIAKLHRLWVRGNVSVTDARGIEVGQKMTVRIPFDDRRVEARVESIDSQVDPETRAVTIRTSIPNPENRIKPGTFVRMALEPGERDGSVEQPAAAVTRGPIEATARDRLSQLERKVDQLLGEREERLSHAKILERLEALERKLDRILDGRR